MTAIDQSIHYFLLNPGKLFACVEAEVWTLNEFETMLSDNTMMDVLPKFFQSPLFVVCLKSAFGIHSGKK
jgi:hypothetical protein